MHKNNNATILIYILVLISIVMIMVIVVLNNSILLENSLDYQILKSDLTKKIKEKGDIQINYDKSLNSDGLGFTDVLSCPDNITMSGGSYYNQFVTTTWFGTGTGYVCSGSSNGISLNLITNNEITTFDKAIWGNETIDLTNNLGNLSGNFSTDSGTLISINSSSYNIPDSIDDNFNDDNYKFNYGKIIQNNLGDNDSNARTSIIGYVTESGSYENIFWNNKFSNEYINNNSNNNENINIKIGEVENGYLKLYVNSNCEIKIVKFNRDLYFQNNELFVIESYNGTINSQTGYLQIIDNNVNLIGDIGSAYQFDFKNNDYAIFIKNNGTGIIDYKIYGETLTKGIYINPINDSYSKEIRILSSHIIINKGVYIGKQFEYIKIK